ncbi:hypothetical protein HY030_04310 [Candidatus Gottesmanbacteria bacterium]|nr:hypothetical protein [Candidatus Gottesmanbacteria bacterium]
MSIEQRVLKYENYLITAGIRTSRDNEYQLIREKLAGRTVILDIDDFLFENTADRAFSILAYIFQLTADQLDRVRPYYYDPATCPVWKEIGIDPGLVPRIIRSIYQIPGLHFALDPNPEAKATLGKIDCMGARITYCTSRRGDDQAMRPFLHKETEAAILNAEFPRGQIYSMANDIAHGYCDSNTSSLNWKLATARKLGADFIGDDDIRVCLAATEVGLRSVLLAAPHNHPKVSGLEIINETNVRIPAGMRVISSLRSLPSALMSLEYETNLHDESMSRSIDLNTWQ